MEIDSPLSWLALAIGWAGFALLALVETSIGSLRWERIQQLVAQGVGGSDSLKALYLAPVGPTGLVRLVKLLFLALTLVSANVLVVTIAGITWAWIVVVAAAVLILLTVTQIAAGVAARWQGETVALRSSAVVHFLVVVTSPFLPALSRAMRPSSLPPADRANSTADDGSPDLRLSIDSAGEPLDEHEVQMIRGVVQLDKTNAREIMVPRVDMVAAELGTSLEEVAEKMMESGYSRIPVYQGDLDHIEGIAYARDILGHLSREDGSAATLVTSVIRPALFIPESKTLEELLTELQERRVHIAIVIDEYGGVSGLVTIEDLLEEIVGEIRDEFDVGEPEIEAVSPNEFMMDARAGIDELNELFNVVVEADGFDTVGGFIYHRLGKIPSAGDLVEYDGLKIEVVSTVGRRVKRLRVTRSAA